MYFSLFILYSCIKQILIIPSSVLIELNLIKCNSTLTERGALQGGGARARPHRPRAGRAGAGARAAHAAARALALARAGAARYRSVVVPITNCYTRKKIT